MLVENHPEGGKKTNMKKEIAEKDSEYSFLQQIWNIYTHARQNPVLPRTDEQEDIVFNNGKEYETQYSGK